MNILLMVSSMGAGGAERVAANLSNGWVARGYTVKLLVTYSKRGSCVYTLDPRIDLTYLSDEVRSNNSKTLVKIFRLLALRKIIKRQNPTVVVSFLTNVNVAAIIASFGLSVPIVVAERSHPPQVSLARSLTWLRKLTYPFASQIVMLTGLGAKWIYENIVSTRTVVIPNPILFPLPDNTPNLNPVDYFSNDRKVLMAVGRLAPEKQVDHLIRAFSIVANKQPDWDLALVGEGPLFVDLQTLVQTLHLGNRIKFIGRAGNLGAWYTRADIYVLCSRFEGFPNTLAEAMVYGCAVVSYDCDTGPKDIVNPGIDGILVPPGDEKMLAKEILDLMSNDNQRTRFSAAAAESVQLRFALPKILDQWDSVFKEL